MLPSGAVWFDAGKIRLIEPSGAIRTLRALPPAPYSPYVIASSASSVAVLAGNNLFAGELPGSVTRVPVQRTGCWRAAPAWPSTFFAVGAGRLVLDAAWECSTGPGVGPQPLFVRPLRGGSWRVLRTLPGADPPILATDGNVIAVGIQTSLRSMHVLVLNLADGRLLDQFAMPDGYLAFAGRERLVLSVPTFATFPIEPGIYVGDAEIGGSSGGRDYRVALYTAGGRLIASLGRASQPPLASGRHLVTIDRNAGGTETVSVRSLVSGATRAVIGFDGQGRQLLTAGFRWPRLAIIETTSSALPAGQFNCPFGTYGPPSAPLVQTLDLAHPAPYLSPPARPPQPTPQQVFARCGPGIP